jgi:cytochrome P450
MTLLSEVVKEVLRLRAPIAIMPSRTAQEDSTFEGYVIPKGVRSISYLLLCSQTTVALGIHAVHHNSKYWKDSVRYL